MTTEPTDLAVTFGDPPPARTRRGTHVSQYLPAVDVLRGRPGEWARIALWTDGGADTSLASGIRRGKRGFTPAGAFEARSAGAVKGRYEVWARFVGDLEPVDTAAVPSPAAVVGENGPERFVPRPVPAAITRQQPVPTPRMVEPVKAAPAGPADLGILCGDCGHPRRLHDVDGQDNACRRAHCSCIHYEPRDVGR